MNKLLYGLIDYLKGLTRRLRRVVRYRLIIPILRSPHSPEYTARGVMVGLIWAFTPAIGIHMMLVLGTWIIVTRIFKWDFSLIQGLAWTWVSNVFTALPLYYLYFLTGQILLGRWNDISGYDSFTVLVAQSFAENQNLWQKIEAMIEIAFLDWGVAMWVGCLPWVILSGWLGYSLSLRFVRRYRIMRALKIARNLPQ